MQSAAHGNFAGRSVFVVGCGYIGSAVAAAMHRSGAEVTALTRNTQMAVQLRAQGTTVIVADAATDQWHEQVRGPFDFVLDCLSGGGGTLEGYRHSYLGGMASLTTWARRAGAIGTLVYTSSTSVYPQGEGAVVDETAATGGDERAQILLSTERLLADANGALGRWFVLRLAGIYGPERHYLLDQVRAGSVAGVGCYRLNLAYRDDIVRAICASFGAPAEIGNELFNVADDGPATKEMIVGWLAEQIGIPKPAFTGEAASRRRGITPDRTISNARIKSRLGWNPEFPTFREGYRAILARRGD